MKNKQIFSHWTRKTRIRVETRNSRTVRSHREITVFCDACNQETVHIPVVETAALLATTDKAVFRLTESNELHSAETDDGRLRICMPCANARAERETGEEKVLYLMEASR